MHRAAMTTPSIQYNTIYPILVFVYIVVCVLNEIGLLQDSECAAGQPGTVDSFLQSNVTALSCVHTAANHEVSAEDTGGNRTVCYVPLSTWSWGKAILRSSIFKNIISCSRVGSHFVNLRF